MTPYTDDEQKQRTIKQNRSLWKYCTLMAESLNDAGFDFKKFLEVTQYKLDVPWTKDLFKEQIWDVVMNSQTGKESSTEMSTIDPAHIHKIVDKRIAELTGVSHAWPDKYTQSQENQS